MIITIDCIAISIDILKYLIINPFLHEFSIKTPVIHYMIITIDYIAISIDIMIYLIIIDLLHYCFFRS